MRARYIAVWLAGIFIYFLIVARITLFDLVVAPIISMVAALIMGGEVVKKPYKAFSPKRWLYGLAYMLYYLLIVEPTCHLRVASMVLGLRDYRPDIVEVSFDYRTDYAIAATANSITNTPGTIVVDIDPRNKKYYVHWLEAYTRDPRVAREKIISVFDKWIKRIFED